MPTSGNELAADAPIQFHLVHAVRGRTRMRVEPPHHADELARVIAALFDGQPGIREIRPNEDCQSVVLEYDPDVLPIEDLLARGQDAPEADWAGWLPARVAGAVIAVGDWTDQALTTGRETARRISALWRSPRDQISAVMTFWRANSVVARSTSVAQSTLPSPTGAGAGSAAAR